MEQQLRAARAEDASSGELLEILLALKAGLSMPLPSDAAELVARFAAVGEHPRIAAASRESAIGSTLSKNDRRVVDVALGSSSVSPKTMAGLASLFRDAAHMHLFLENSDKIDYLQIDGARLSQLQRDAKHDLRITGVESRCFAAASLEAVLDELERLSSQPVPAT